MCGWAELVRMMSSFVFVADGIGFGYWESVQVLRSRSFKVVPNTLNENHGMIWRGDGCSLLAVDSAGI
jgi:hypothetical protein